MTGLPNDFHAADDYRAGMTAAAQAVGLEPPAPVFVEVQTGSAVFHAGETWHGSGPNETADVMRRSSAVHYLPISAEFGERPGGYIYRRYQLTGSRHLDESFFPILWSRAGKLTAWLNSYGVRQ